VLQTDRKICNFIARSMVEEVICNRFVVRNVVFHCSSFDIVFLFAPIGLLGSMCGLSFCWENVFDVCFVTPMNLVLLSPVFYPVSVNFLYINCFLFQIYISELPVRLMFYRNNLFGNCTCVACKCKSI
jgi:hypothetical protein